MLSRFRSKVVCGSLTTHMPCLGWVPSGKASAQGELEAEPVVLSDRVFTLTAPAATIPGETQQNASARVVLSLPASSRSERTMKNEKRVAYVTRDHIMKLLSDDEIASVSTAETASALAKGDEYIDLEKLDAGVLRAGANMKKATPMGAVLTRKAVQPSTWTKIVTQLAAPAT